MTETIDPRAPVLVGAGQVLQRIDDPREGVEPIELIARAAREAAEDAGAPGLLAAADSIRVPKGLWKYTDAAALLRERLGAAGATTATAPISGSSVQRLISDAALAIAAGRMDVVLVAGGEAERSKRRAAAREIDLAWTVQEGPEPDETIGTLKRFVAPEEVQARVFQPPTVFSLFENALRADAGRSFERHREQIGALWSRMSEVASRNPNAWSRDALSADEITTPTPDNRLTAYPYTKRLCANMVVDMAAAVLVCSAQAARRFGVPRDRWVYLHAATDAEHAPRISHRDSFLRCDEIRVAGQRVCELSGIEAADAEYLDVYSCFPSAVQVAARELGLPLDRELSVTGGLAYAGGPFNSYVLHAVATLMDRLRADPGSRGLVTSVGGWFAKHAFAVYSTSPPERGFQHADLDAELAGTPRRELAVDVTSEAVVETYALAYQDGRPAQLSASCLLPDGRRTWAVNDDATLIEGVLREELCGRAVRVRRGGAFDPT